MTWRIIHTSNRTHLALPDVQIKDINNLFMVNEKVNIWSNINHSDHLKITYITRDAYKQHRTYTDYASRTSYCILY